MEAQKGPCKDVGRLRAGTHGVRVEEAQSFS